MKIKCKYCNHNKFIDVIDLGSQPFSGFFPNIHSKDPPKSRLNLIRCKKCSLIQIKHSVYIESSYYLTFGYNSGLSKLMIRHLQTQAKKIISFFKPKGNISVLDIGSNDGTFLGSYKKKIFQTRS